MSDELARLLILRRQRHLARRKIAARVQRAMQPRCRHVLTVANHLAPQECAA